MLRSLYLHHFRNYREAFFEFGPKFNILFGSNAQGKTSVLEAIHYLMMGRSFRSHQNSDLIQTNTSSFYLEAHFTKHGVDQTLKISFDGRDRKMIYNSTPLPSVSSLLGILSGVVLFPDDADLIKGPPLLRRQFLDLQLAQIDPLYVHHLTRYTKALRQRNQLLKAKKILTIESWEQEMSQSAAYLYAKRKLTIDQLKLYCQPIYETLTKKKEELGIEYKPALALQGSVKEIQDLQMAQLRKYRPRELLCGFTLIGPHKDDITFTINEKDARFFASEGQQRSYINAVRLAEWQHLNKITYFPFLLVDDVGLGLDRERKNNLTDMLATAGQVFLTTTNQNLLDHLPAEKKLFSICNGSIVR